MFRLQWSVAFYGRRLTLKFATDFYKRNAVVRDPSVKMFWMFGVHFLSVMSLISDVVDPSVWLEYHPESVY